MKLDVKHLDRLIAEELQTLFEQEMLDPNVGLAAQQRAAEKAKETAKALKTDDKSKTTTAAPKTDDKSKTTTAAPGEGRDAMRMGKRLADDPRYAWQDVPGGTRSGASGQYILREPVDPYAGIETPLDRLGRGIAGATPIVGGVMTAKNIAADKEAGGVEKTVRHAANIAQEVIPSKKIGGLFKGAQAATRATRGTMAGHGATAGVTIAQAGDDPVDDFIKRSFQRLPGRKRTPEAEKKHQAQQKQAKAAQDPTARSAARDGLTAAELDAQNKKRLAARGMGAPTSAKDAAAQKAWSASQLAKTQKKAPTATLPPVQTGGSGKGDIRKEPTYTRRQGSLPLQRESVRTNNNMLTENQIKRFQKLANCRSPQKRLITEAMDPLSIIGIILGVLVIERVRTAYEKTILEPLWGTEPEEEADPWADAPMATTIKFVWNKLKDVATSRSQKGDSSLESVLGTLESEAEGGAQQLSPEQIAMIQERFGDDEELAGLLAQLAEVEEEDYREVLSQVEQHIRSKLGT